ncbi:MAG: tetratricopeptide repeat protein [Enterobacteriaceae bacterium]|jgi:tetratricopeptide (TPR) repeat protein|nr:tetratricopeptide repeat protein [Enterobacteriaceae bacterium]
MKNKWKNTAPKTSARQLQQTVTQLLLSGQGEEAWKKIQARLIFSPRDTWFLDEAARYCRRNGKFDEAIRYYQRSLAIQTRNAYAQNGIGLAYYEQGKYDEAEKYYRNALSIEPSYVGCHNNYAIMLHKMDRYQEAIEQYELALKFDPDYVNASYGLASVFAHIQQLDAAKTQLNHLVEHHPNDIRSQTALGMILLQQGDFKQGWRLYRGRYSAKNIHRFVKSPALKQPYWNGRNLQEKRILVYREQGLGDEIQFCRFAARLKQEKGASAVYLVCKQAVYPLFRQLPHIDKVIIEGDEMPDFDTWVLLLDLPRYFLNSAVPFGIMPPYFSADPALLAKWLLPKNTDSPLRVGLVWKGTPQHNNDSHRSLKNLNELRPLWDVAGIEWISLQKGAGEEEALAAPTDMPIRALGHQVQNYADTAAIISQLDLVISVDTSVAHLAGAMNKPCWVLIPAIATDWRWQQKQETSVWYPSMRLFRREITEEWDKTIIEIRDALMAWQEK